MRFKDYVDKVFIINLINRDDRKIAMQKQLCELGFYDDIADGTIEFVEAVKLPFIDENIVKAIGDLGKGNFYSMATQTYNVGLCNCSIEHYRVIKQAYARGYNKILVLEDDARFIKNVQVIEKCLATMPQDFDILHLEGFYWPDDDTHKKECINALSPTIEDAKWEHSFKLKMFGAAALIYSREGMKKYLFNQEEVLFQYSDYYTYQMDANSYFYNYPIAIQQEMIESNITSSKNNFLSINVYLHYINREDYFNYA